MKLSAVPQSTGITSDRPCTILGDLPRSVGQQV